MSIDTSAHAELLSDHNLFRTKDLEQARDEVARVFCPHRLVTTSGTSNVDTVHNRVTLGQVSLNYLDYGTEVEIEPGELGSFFLVQMPLSGGSEITCGKSSVSSSVSMASVPSPTEQLRMVWHDDSPHLLVHVARSTAENRLRELMGHELIAPLRFELGMDLTTPAARSWKRLIDHAVADADVNGLTMAGPIRNQLEDLILTGLLMAHQHNYSDCLTKEFRPAAPRVVREAIALFEQAPEQAPTLTEMAAAAGVSIRSLQVGFQQYMGMSPTEYFRDLRLQRARELLLHADSSSTQVADVAFSLGFTHLGRFAQAYRKRHGELPSQTLREAMSTPLH